MDDTTQYTLRLQPEGNGATTVTEPRTARQLPAGARMDTVQFVRWWYSYSDGDVATDSSAAQLCLIHESGDSRCNDVWSLRSDTLRMREHGGKHVRLTRVP